jgi:hypothetical protein
MPDDLDPQLLRRFAGAARPLAAQDFTASLEQQLRARRGPGFGARELASTLGTILSGLGGAVLLPLRLRHARLMVVGAAAVSVCTAFL